MNLKSVALLALLSIAFLSSCKKDNDNPTPTPEPTPAVKSYLLKTGNYWVSETIYIDEFGKEHSTPDYDSVYIEKDTLINGIKWFKQVTTGMSFGTDHKYVFFWRDSSGVLINNYGAKPREQYKTPGVVSTSIALNGTDTLYKATAILQAQDTIVTIPAGTFKAKNIKNIFYFPGNPPQLRYRESYNLYSEELDVLIYRTTFYAMDKGYYLSRLVRYSVK